MASGGVLGGFGSFGRLLVQSLCTADQLDHHVWSAVWEYVSNICRIIFFCWLIMDWSVWNSDGDVTLRYRIQSNWTISTAYYYNQHCLVQTCRHLEAPAQSKVPQTIVKRGESSKNNNQAAIILVLTLVYYRSADLEQSCQYIYITFTFQFDSVFIRTEPDISLHFSALLCISLNFYAFLYTSLRFSALYILGQFDGAYHRLMDAIFCQDNAP